MRFQEGLCVLGAWCLICQDPVSCYFYFVSLSRGPELWWVLCCILICFVSMDLFVLCVACLTVFVNCVVKQFAICLGVFVTLSLNVMELLSVVGGALFDRSCMVFQRMCVLCVWSHMCFFHMFVCVFVCRKLFPHLGVWELDHRCLLSLCCFFVWFCVPYLRVRACNCYASCPLVCCACLPSVWCLWKLCWQCVYWCV